MAKRAVVEVKAKFHGRTLRVSDSSSWCSPNSTGVDLSYILHFTSDSKGSKQHNIHSITGPKSNHVKLSF